MKSTLVQILFFAIVLGHPSTSVSSDKPVKVTTPLSADEVAVYNAVLQQYTAKDSGALSVSTTTFPLNPDSPAIGLSRAECLQGIQLENLSTASHSFHSRPTSLGEQKRSWSTRRSMPRSAGRMILTKR